VNEIDTVTGAAEVNEIVTVRDRGGGGERGGAAELATTKLDTAELVAAELVAAELVTSSTCRVYFGGVHGCGDEEAVAEEANSLTVGTTFTAGPTCRVCFGGVHGCGDDDDAAEEAASLRFMLVQNKNGNY
jgi:hypothetical protein